jgi:hypothetical protein
LGVPLGDHVGISPYSTAIGTTTQLWTSDPRVTPPVCPQFGGWTDGSNQPIQHSNLSRRGSRLRGGTVMKFEYRLVHMRLFERDLRLIQQEVNDLAKQGWQLVQVCGLHNQIFVFEHEVSPAPEAATSKKRNKSDG